MPGTIGLSPGRTSFSIQYISCLLKPYYFAPQPDFVAALTIQHTVQSLYNTTFGVLRNEPCINKSCWKETILQRNYSWSFSYNTFVKFYGKKNVGATTTWPCYIQIHFIIGCVTKGLHCTHISNLYTIFNHLSSIIQSFGVYILRSLKFGPYISLV